MTPHVETVSVIFSHVSLVVFHPYGPYFIFITVGEQVR